MIVTNLLTLEWELYSIGKSHNVCIALNGPLHLRPLEVYLHPLPNMNYHNMTTVDCIMMFMR